MLQRTVYKLFIMSVLGCFISPSFAMTADASGNNTSAQAKASQDVIKTKRPTFSLTLQSNYTTGYKWFIKKYDSSMISVVGHRYIRNKSQMIGAGGVENWVFHINKNAFNAPHILSVTMTYARPFDIKNGTDKTFTIMTQQRK